MYASSGSTNLELHAKLQMSDKSDLVEGRLINGCTSASLLHVDLESLTLLLISFVVPASCV